MKNAESKTTLPTPLELARFALELRDGKDDHLELWDGHIMHAFNIWEKADSFLSGREKAREKLALLVNGTFTLDRATWEAHVDEFPGWERRNTLAIQRVRHQITAALNTKSHPAGYVHKKLFSDNSLTVRTREVLVFGLVDFAQRNGIRWAGKTIDSQSATTLKTSLAKPTIGGALGRWAYEVRQDQIAKAKTRT